jgi:DNA invertase Pin-like site-specific DNA recombinase
MREERYVSYFRVSTDRQGVSGLGLDAQREAVGQFIRARQNGNAPGCTIAEFVEIESGAKNDRPQLALALETCRRHKATLLIAKLDRLARNVAFIANLMEAGVDFIACDMPHASRLVLHVMAAFAEHEREMIRDRTKAALAAAKARGVKLGINGARLAAANHAEAVAWTETVAEHVQAARMSGAKTLTAIAAYLNENGVPSREGKRWHASNVARTVRRLREAERRCHVLTSNVSEAPDRDAGHGSSA